MPPSPAEALLATLVRLDPEARPADEAPLQLADPDRTTLAADPAAAAVLETAVADRVAAGDIPGTVRVLDVLLALAVAPGAADAADAAARYFDALESAVSMLRAPQLALFWPYFERRSQQIGDLAQGPNSITLLRTCRSLILRLNRESHREQIGRVLQYLAVAKGFPHPSRINKKGKLFPGKMEPLDALPSQGGGPGLTPFRACQTLADLAGLGAPSDVTAFGDQLVLRLREPHLSARHDGPVALPRPDSAWSQLTGDAHDILLTQAVMAFSTYRAPGTEADVARILDALKSMKSKTDLAILDNRVLPSDELWATWKHQQCLRFEPTPVSPLDQTPSADPVPESVPPLTRVVGNSELTRLLDVPFGLDKFAVPSAQSPRLADLLGSIETSTTPQEKAARTFQSLRLQPWGALVDQFGAAPVAEHPEVAAQEDEVQRKLKEAQTPPPPVKRPMQPPENPSKRARVSYEDAVYSERHAAAEGTARPLPY